MKVLVTGSAGFIGFFLAQRLLKEGFEVVGIDNINDYYDVNLKYARLAETGIYSPEEQIHKGGENRVYAPISFHQEITSVTNLNYRFIRMNLEDKAELNALFEKEKFDYVVNLAAQAGVRYSLENPDAYVQSNIVGFLNILEACRHNPVKHLVYASSSSVYGANSKVPFSEDDKVDNPVSLYAATKKSNELMAHCYSHLYQIPTTGLRFFTVYGPWGRPDMAPILFATAIAKGEPIKVFNNGEMERDFTFVDDILEGVYRILLLPSEDIPAYRVNNIGNGSPVKLMEFIQTMEKVMGIDANKIMMPMQDGDVVRTWADTRLLQAYTMHKSQITVENGVDMFFKWFMEYQQSIFSK